jgi:hypothetical protein
MSWLPYNIYTTARIITQWLLPNTPLLPTAEAAFQAICKACNMPKSPMRAFWRLRGEVLIVGVMPIPQNIRLRWHVPSILLEMAAMVSVFSVVFPWRQVVLRFGLASGLSIMGSWAMDYNARREFLAARLRATSS